MGIIIRQIFFVVLKNMPEGSDVINKNPGSWISNDPQVNKSLIIPGQNGQWNSVKSSLWTSG